MKFALSLLIPALFIVGTTAQGATSDEFDCAMSIRNKKTNEIVSSQKWRAAAIRKLSLTLPPTSTGNLSSQVRTPVAEGTLVLSYSHVMLSGQDAARQYVCFTGSLCAGRGGTKPVPAPDTPIPSPQDSEQSPPDSPQDPTQPPPANEPTRQCVAMGCAPTDSSGNVDWKPVPIIDGIPAFDPSALTNVSLSASGNMPFAANHPVAVKFLWTRSGHERGAPSYF